MHILYVALKYDYGQPERGYSFEHHNFYDTLVHMNHDILYFDFMTLMQEHGRRWMKRRLLEIVKTEKPDLLFCILHKDELDKDTICNISQNTDTITLNWFCDDHWRFDNFSRYWAPCFNWVVTTAKGALPKYVQLGYRNVIKSQWACNHFLYRKLNLPLIYDVTFVGQPHGNRREIVQALRDTGINVQTWGTGWESDRLSQEEMIKVFNQSRINLNLSNASTSSSGSSKINVFYRGQVIRKLLSQFLDKVPSGREIKKLWKVWLGKGGKHRKNSNVALVFTHGNQTEEYPEQIKGRNFEVPGCGGFLLTGVAENLEDYYEVGKEIVVFDDVGDLAAKVKYYLEHEEKRELIAKAGHERTLREHTYEKRFEEIFSKIGIK